MEFFNRENKIEKEKKLIERWSWITEDIAGYDEKLNTCIVLENSYGKMIQEGQLSQGWLESEILNEGALNEAPMTSANVGSNLIPKVMFPIIKRVIPQLTANKLVSVQPLTQPTGVIYYILYSYSNTKGNIVAKNEFSMNANQTSPAYAVFYSSEKVGPFSATMSSGGNTTISTGSSITGFLGTDATQFTIKRIEVYANGAQVPTILSTTRDGSFAGTGANVAYAQATGEITLLDNVVADGTTVTVYFVYDQEGSKFIPEMEFSIESMTVGSTERKIKIRWTKESEQDMQAYHKIDVESELVKVASLQMNYEIDREILTFINDSIISALSFTHDWTADSSTTGNNTSGNFLDRHRALAQKLHTTSAIVSQYNRVSPCTWAVVSPKIAALLQMLPDWKGDGAANGNTIYDAGQLGGKLEVYVDPNRVGATASEILMGYKSDNTTYGAGVVYSPYTNWMSNTVTNVENFDSVRGFFNRYALTKVVRGEYNYARVTLENF